MRNIFVERIVKVFMLEAIFMVFFYFNGICHRLLCILLDMFNGIDLTATYNYLILSNLWALDRSIKPSYYSFREKILCDK